jgi:AraC-like DNA-binding protein
VSSCSQIFSDETLLRSVHEMAERIAELHDLPRPVRGRGDPLPLHPVQSRQFHHVGKPGFVGTAVEFGATTDEFALNANARELPLIHADPYLNNLLLKYCETAITDRRGNVSQLRTRVENAISSLLPHGRVVVDDVARSLGMSDRTLARKLSDEGLSFTEVLQQLRRDLAVQYLDDPKLHVSKIAWLLGFNEVSAFTHAFKRWSGKTPSQMLTTAVSSDFVQVTQGDATGLLLPRGPGGFGC